MCVPVCVSVSLSISAQETEGRRIEEVVVTAEKVEETLQQVSQSVSVIDEDQFTSGEVRSLLDLESHVPGLTVNKNEGIRRLLTIRGIGNESNQSSNSLDAVSLHLDGFYLVSSFANYMDDLDLSRIEVLRGPQGSVLGQNSNGGSILMHSRAPEVGKFALDDFVLEIGNFNSRAAKVSASIGKSESVASRHTFSLSQHDGYATNVQLDQRLDDKQVQLYQGNWRFRLGDSSELRLLTLIHDSSGNGSAQKGIYDETPGARNLSQDTRAEFRSESEILGLHYLTDIAGATLNALVSGQWSDGYSFRDNDRHAIGRSSQFIPQAQAEHTIAQDVLTTEVYLTSSSERSDGLSWTLGYFHYESDLHQFFYELIDFGVDGSFDSITVDDVRSFALGDYGFIGDSDQTRESSSFYAQAQTNITDNLRVIGGLRSTNAQVISYITNFYGREGANVVSQEESAWTGRLSLEQYANENVMLYGTLSKGFRPGSANLTFGREDEIAPIVIGRQYEAETVLSAEFGLKAAGDRTTFNLVAFRYFFDNLQYQGTDPEVFQGGVSNVPESEVLGIEIETLLLLGENWTICGHGTLLTSEVRSSHELIDNVESDRVTNELLASGLPLFGPDIQRARAAVITDIEGNELAKVPNLAIGGSVEYWMPIEGTGDLTFKLQANYRDKYFYRLFNNPRIDVVEGHSRFDMRVSYKPLDSNWSVSLAVNNLTDVEGVNSRFTDVYGVGATCEEYIAPRTVSLRFRFDQ